MTASNDREGLRRATRLGRSQVTLALAALLLGVSCSGGGPEHTERSAGTAPSRPVSPSAASTVTMLAPAAHVDTGLTDASLAAGGGLVITYSAQGVVAIDPESQLVLWRAETPGTRASVGFRSVWVSDFDASVVRRLELRTGRLLAEIPLPDNPIGVVVHADRVWVAAHRGGSVSRIDPATNTVVSITDVGPGGPRGPMELAASGRRVYVGVNNSNQVVELDAGSAEVTRRVTLPEAVYACGPITPDGTVVWITSCLESDHVARVDLRTGRVSSSDGLRMYVGQGVARGRVIWFAGRPVSSSAPVGFVGLDRRTADVVGRLGAEDTLDGSVAAFGSWWVSQGDGVARFRLEDLTIRP